MIIKFVNAFTNAKMLKAYNTLVGVFDNKLIPAMYKFGIIMSFFARLEIIYNKHKVSFNLNRARSNAA